MHPRKSGGSGDVLFISSAEGRKGRSPRMGGRGGHILLMHPRRAKCLAIAAAGRTATFTLRDDQGRTAASVVGPGRGRSHSQNGPDCISHVRDHHRAWHNGGHRASPNGANFLCDGWPTGKTKTGHPVNKTPFLSSRQRCPLRRGPSEIRHTFRSFRSSAENQESCFRLSAPPRMALRQAISASSAPPRMPWKRSCFPLLSAPPRTNFCVLRG